MLYQKKNNTLEPLTGSTLYAETPIGTVIASFLAIAPSGYIKADDTVYTKAAYPELYERIPDVFKDTVNETFTIDLREVALKGIGLSSLTTEHYSNTGLTLGEFIEDRIQTHRHSVMNRNAGGTNTNYNFDGANNSKGFYGNVITTSPYDSSTRVGDTTEVKSVGVNYFIKAKHVALPIDITENIESIAFPSYLDTFEYLINGTSGVANPDISATVTTSGMYAINNVAYNTSADVKNCAVFLNGQRIFTAGKYAAGEYANINATLYLHAGDIIRLQSDAAPNNAAYFSVMRIA